MKKSFPFDLVMVQVLKAKHIRHALILIRFISLMEMETLQMWIDSEGVVATCSLGIKKPVADYHLVAISASESLLNFSLNVNKCQSHSIWLTLSVS